MSDVLIQFTEEQLRAMPEEERHSLAISYVNAVGATDLVEYLNAGVTIGKADLLDFINAGQLTVGEQIWCSRAAISPAEVVGGGALFNGGVYRSPRSLLYDMIRRPVTRGPRLQPLWRLRVVRASGSSATLASLLSAVEADMRLRAAMGRLIRVLRAVRNPVNHCSMCGRERREISRVSMEDLCGPGSTLIQLFCGHTVSLAKPAAA
jgi:hypothetical protein